MIFSMEDYEPKTFEPPIDEAPDARRDLKLLGRDLKLFGLFNSEVAERVSAGRMECLDEECEKTKTGSPSEEPKDGEPCSAHGGPTTSCAAARTPPLPPSALSQPDAHI